MKKETDKQLKECQKLKDEYLAGWKRARADFLNYKKDEGERMEKAKDYIKEDLLLKILPILDNIYVAESKTPDDLKENQWVKGLLQVKSQILDFLKSEGVEEIKSKGQKFNPNFHEAAVEVEADNKESGVIIEEIKKGYSFNNKIIRPTRVKISK